MSLQMISYLTAGLMMALAAVGTAVSIAMVCGKAMEGTARQPEAANAIRTSMVIAVSFIEAIALYALVIALILVTK